MDGPSRSRSPWGLLGMLVLVGSIEGALASRPLRFAETASLNWRLTAADIPREASRCEVACLGDSLMKIGVIPELIRSGTGKRTFNFGMARAPAPATYFMFRRLLEAGGRPSALLVEFKPSILTGGPRLSVRQFQETLTLAESWELVRDTGNIKLLPQILLGRVMPSVRYRLEVRESILSAFDGKTAPTYQTNRIALRNWTINRGAHLNSPESTFSGAISEQIHQWFRSDDWKCHKVNEMYVDRLLKLARSRSIPVYWVIPPLPPPLQERRERSGVDAAYAEFVRSMQARHPEVTVVDGRRSGYESAVFSDHTHLNGRGSIALSHELAAIVAKPEAHQPGWIKLPDYRGWPMDFPGETADKSTIALRNGSMRR